MSTFRVFAACRIMPWLVLGAAACFASAVLAFGLVPDGLAHSSIPLDVLGATGMAHAAAFNAAGFLVPGTMIAMVGVAMYLDARSARSRIGTLILLFSALAFAGLGVFPLDSAHPGATANRLHALSWSLWWLTIAAGAVLSHGNPGVSGRRGPWPMAGIALALLVPVCALFAPAIVGGAIAQPLAYAAWFAWWWLAAVAISRNATSAPGSSPPAGR